MVDGCAKEVGAFFFFSLISFPRSPLSVPAHFLSRGDTADAELSVRRSPLFAGHPTRNRKNLRPFRLLLSLRSGNPARRIIRQHSGGHLLVNHGCCYRRQRKRECGGRPARRAGRCERARVDGSRPEGRAPFLERAAELTRAGEAYLLPDRRTSSYLSGWTRLLTFISLPVRASLERPSSRYSITRLPRPLELRKIRSIPTFSERCCKGPISGCRWNRSEVPARLQARCVFFFLGTRAPVDSVPHADCSTTNANRSRSTSRRRIFPFLPLRLTPRAEP